MYEPSSFSPCEQFRGCLTAEGFVKEAVLGAAAAPPRGLLPGGLSEAEGTKEIAALSHLSSAGPTAAWRVSLPVLTTPQAEGVLIGHVRAQLKPRHGWSAQAPACSSAWPGSCASRLMAPPCVPGCTPSLFSGHSPGASPVPGSALQAENRTVDELQQGPLPGALLPEPGVSRELVVTGPEQSTLGSVIESGWGPGGLSEVAPRRQTLLLREMEGRTDSDPSGPGKPAESWAPDILVEPKNLGQGLMMTPGQLW